MMDKWIGIIVTNWTEVDILWCRENIQGQYAGMGNYWYFEREEDLTLFVLRWL
jgi:hypothetical protein